MGVLTFGTYSAARSHLKDVFDAAESGRTAVLRRDNVDSVVVNGAQLRQFLAVATSGRMQVVPESDGWSLMLPGTAIAAHAGSLDDAFPKSRISGPRSPTPTMPRFAASKAGARYATLAG